MKNFNICFREKVAVVTGGAGVLCSAIAEGLADEGASTAVLDIREDAAEKTASRLRKKGTKSLAVKVDVTNRTSVEKACGKVTETFGKVDILVNGAGGNDPRASTSPELSFFDISQKALDLVINLNLIGTIIPSQVFGKIMADRDSGVILNFSSMNAIRPLTRIPAYSAAKGGVSNFTQWLAVHLSQNYSKRIRVNALAPGFFVTRQTRYLLLDEKGNPSSRGKSVLEHTPMKRFGAPEDLVGVALFLLSDKAAFINGAIVPVDGGFSVYSGV